MCRLLAGTGGAERSLLDRLQDLGCVHGHGWGMAWWTPDGDRGYVRRPVPAQEEGSGYRLAAEELMSRDRPTFITHIRRASKGRHVEENTHPFVADGWTFAHNGTIHDIAREPERTDSEAFFRNRLLPRLKDADPVAAIGAAAASVRSYTCVNVLLSDGRRLYALELHQKEPDNYALLWRQVDGRIDVASANVALPDWETLPARGAPLPAGWRRLGNGNLLAVEAGAPRVVNGLVTPIGGR